jgi:hypothetical protein
MPALMRPPFYAAPLGLVVLWWRRSSWSAALFLTGFLICSFVAVLPGFHFRPHYYVLLMPVLALLAGALVEEATQLLRAGRFRFLAPAPALLFAFFLLKGIVHEQNLFFRLTPVAVSRSLYGFEPFPEAKVLADYIRAHSSPDDRVAVLGSEPEIYFYARRQSATGYLYTYPLLEHQPFADQMRRQMKQEIEAARPLFLIQVRAWTSWQSRPATPQRIAGWCDALTPPNYKLIAACDYHPDEGRVDWCWEPGRRTDPSGAASELLLFQRE